MSARLFWTKGLLSRGQPHCRWQICASINDPGRVGAEKRAVTSRRNSTVATDFAAGVEVATKGVSMDEIELSLSDGMVLRGQRWTHRRKKHSPGSDDASCDVSLQTPKKTRILALHGWLDNCRSFHYLAPKLVEKVHRNNNKIPYEAEVELVAIDLPGHGWSSHRPLDGPTTVLSEGVYHIAEIIDALGWGLDNNSDGVGETDTEDTDHEKVALIGHSMGGGMAITYAGVFPEQISKVVSIDIYGPEPGKPEQAVSNIRSHVSQRRSSFGPRGRPHTLYPSLEKAVERRQKAASMALKGNLYLSQEAAKELVTRSMEAVYNDGDQGDDGSSNRSLQGYRFRHDARLLWPSLQYLTAEQIQSILETVECPVCILAGKDGYPFAQDRIDRVVAALEPDVHEILPGSHHLHADPDTADAVVDVVYDFFRARDGGEE